MLSFLKIHPFAVEAYFEQSLVITFACDSSRLKPLLPPCLEPDTFGRWGFVAVALVQTRELRPKGFPRFLGSDFFLSGYRVFVRYRNRQGRRLRGLYILRSETNRKKMEWMGNIFTHYQYVTTDIDKQFSDGITRITSAHSGFRVSVDEREPVQLPEGSPFANWEDARRFAGPLPFTFTYDASTSRVLIIEGVRQQWSPRPVNLLECHFPFVNRIAEGLVPANAFMVRDTPYYWKKGRIEAWKK